MLAGALILLLPRPSDLSVEGQRTLAIAVAVAVLFVTEPIPLPAVALLIAVMQVVLGVTGPARVASTFMSDSVFFIMGSLMIGVAIVKQNLDKRFAYYLLRATGSDVRRISAGLLGVSALLASVVGEHTVAAIMLPVCVTLIRLTREQEQAQLPRLTALLLLSIAYGCALAALGTPSGGARNAVMIDYWRRLYGTEVSYAEWVAHAYPLVLLLIPVAVWTLRRSFPTEVTDLQRTLVSLRRLVREEGRWDAADLITVGVFALTLLAWVTVSGTIGLGIVALAGASLYLVLGLVQWEDYNAGVNWGVILLYASALSLGIAMQGTGAAEWLGSVLLASLPSGALGLPVAILAVIGLVTILFTAVMSSGPAVAVLGPVLLNVAFLSGVGVVAAGFVVAISSAFAFLTPTGTPAARIIYASGYLRQHDFRRPGLALTLVSLALMLVLAFAYWPLLGPRGSP
ncbi:MAG: DASS family sodium-coupled anion symporter [Gemmatimonadetes bacterium]|nr:DASS family sodium-coupled anion symporter [Gemmatimonadota bacterium]